MPANATRQRVRAAARKDAKQVAKLVTVAEAEAAALRQQLHETRAQLAAAEAVITGVSALQFDYVDPVTGEVTRRPLFPTS